jgi:RimJ/RimL family protein N-acetyltransferase
VKVTLRAVEDDDLPILFENQRDAEANAMAAFGALDPHDRAAFDEHWQRIRAMEDVVVRTIEADGEVAGSISRWRDPALDAPEISYWLGRSFWGRGVATQAVRQFLERLPDPRLYGRVANTNPAQRVLEKCGFVVARTDRDVPATDGRLVDEAVLVLERS